MTRLMLAREFNQREGPDLSKRLFQIKPGSSQGIPSLNVQPCLDSWMKFNLNVDQPWQAADRWMTFPEKVVVRGLGIKLNQRDSESLCAASYRPQLYTGVGQNSVQTISSKANKIIQHFLSTSPLPQAQKKLPGFRQFIGLYFLSNENVDSWVIWGYSPAYLFGGFSK